MLTDASGHGYVRATAADKKLQDDDPTAGEWESSTEPPVDETPANTLGGSNARRERGGGFDSSGGGVGGDHGSLTLTEESRLLLEQAGVSVGGRRDRDRDRDSGGQGQASAGGGGAGAGFGGAQGEKRRKNVNGGLSRRLFDRFFSSA